MRAALDPALRDFNLTTHSDDFEKVCGNGWFDTRDAPKVEAYRTFLEWVAAHRSWFHVVTTDDLKGGDCVGTIDVETAIDPAIDPHGIHTVDLSKNGFHFDTWVDVWRQFRGDWLGRSIGEIVGAAEHALLHWPNEDRNRLYELAWLVFLGGQHENAWNKQPVDPKFGDPDTAPMGAPEDFTVVAGFQTRNVLVWLKASVWATWAKGTKDRGTYCNSGPVFGLIRALPGQVTVPGQSWDPARDAQHWDADPYPTMVVYNSQALVVIDANGACVTHAFVMREDGPVTVSGTGKCYQYRAIDRAIDLIECDGPMLQNTIWTPNHRYLGSDLIPAAPALTVDWDDNRPGSRLTTVPRRVPQMFNYYDLQQNNDIVVSTYLPGQHLPPNDLDQKTIRRLLEQDGQAASAGSHDDRVIWHSPVQFTKTFTLDGTKLRVSYDGLPIGTVVDNEVCVNLLEGLNGVMLTRKNTTQTSSASVTISGNPGQSTRISIVNSGRFTAASLCCDDNTSADFLATHRVLTDAVQGLDPPRELVWFGVPVRGGCRAPA